MIHEQSCRWQDLEIQCNVTPYWLILELPSSMGRDVDLEAPRSDILCCIRV